MLRDYQRGHCSFLLKTYTVCCTGVTLFAEYLQEGNLFNRNIGSLYQFFKENGYLYLNLLFMVTVIKKGVDIKKSFKILEKALKSKGVDTHKYCGTLDLNEDALTIQKRMRDEWQ